MKAEQLWKAFGVQADYEAWAFGDEPDHLASLVCKGIKTGTASAYPVYEAEGEKVPEAGEYSVILDSKDEAVCVIRTTRVRIIPFRDVPADHAWKEGEGDRSLAYWREVHEEFFIGEMEEAGLVFTEDMPVVCEEFEVVYQPALDEAVQRFFRGDASGHDWFHTHRVVNLAIYLAEKEGADAPLCRLAALLHDVDDYKLTGGDFGVTEHAVQLMKDFGFSEETRDKVCAIIAKVSFKGADTEIPESLEGRIVQDADRLDAIGAIGIGRTFAYGGSRGQAMYDPAIVPQPGKTAEEYRKNSNTTINHFYEKLLLLKDMMNTDTARILAEHRHQVMEGFLKEFYAEWDFPKA